MKNTSLETRPLLSGAVLAKFLFLLVITLVAVSIIPQSVPMQAVVSDSYLFGYNNRAGLILIYLFAALASLVISPDYFSYGDRDQHWKAKSRGWYAATLFCCLFMFVFTAYLDGFGESNYFIYRVKSVLAGARPYQDFEFAYGPGLLYIPAFLVRVLHLSAVDAYYMVWTGSALLGIAALRGFLGYLDFPSRGKQRVFNLFCGVAAVSLLSTGLNYTLLRFAVPLYLLGALHYQIEVRGQSVMFLLAPLLVAVTLAISPEIAIVTGIALIAFAILRMLARRGTLLHHVLGCLGVVAALWVARLLHFFEAVKTFSSGGNNFPIVPAVHIVILVSSLFICGVLVVQAVRNKGTLSFTFLAIIYGMGMLPGALGRCDPSHVAFYGLPLIAVALLAIYEIRSVSTWAYYACWVFLPLLSLAGLLWINRLNLPAAIVTKPGPIGSAVRSLIDTGRTQASRNPSVASEKAENSQASSQTQFAIPLLNSGEVFNAPFGLALNYRGSYYSSNVDFGYHVGILNVFDQRQIDRKVAELQDHADRRLVLPVQYHQRCADRNGSGSRRLIRILFAFPYLRRAQHQASIYRDLCDYIDSNYHPSPGDIQTQLSQGFLLMERNSQ